MLFNAYTIILICTKVHKFNIILTCCLKAASLAFAGAETKENILEVGAKPKQSTFNSSWVCVIAFLLRAFFMYKNIDD